MKNFIILFLCFLLFSSCFTSWSSKKRSKFSNNCINSKIYGHNSSIDFINFKNSDFDFIWVKEYSNDILLDSFKIFVYPNLDSSKLNNRRYSSIDRSIIPNHKYIFLIPKQKSYELIDMEMKMVPRFTMFSENWACILTKYCIDGNLQNGENLEIYNREENTIK